MLSRKKLHGDDAETSRRNVSADTPPYSNVPDVSSTTSTRRGCVVAGGAQVAAGEPFHFHLDVACRFNAARRCPIAASGGRRGPQPVR